MTELAAVRNVKNIAHLAVNVTIVKNIVSAFLAMITETIQFCLYMKTSIYII